MELRLTWQVITHKIREYRARVPAMEKLWGWPALLIALWMMILLYIPFVERTWGEKVFPASIALSVLIQSTIVVFLITRAIGTQRTVNMAGKVVFLTWAIEVIGTATKLPFGSYRYTKHLQPQLMNVPLVIPLAWLMMLPPAWTVARCLSGRRSGVAFIVLSALAFTAWDLFLDPQMVKWGLWIWEGTGHYFGIPWVNFVGWILASGFITALVHPTALPERPLLLIYSLTCIMETAGLLLFWDLHGPALFGFTIMATFALFAYYFKRREGRIGLKT